MSADIEEFYAHMQAFWAAGIPCEEVCNQLRDEPCKVRVRELYRELDTLADQAAAINEPVIRSAQ